MIVEIMEDLLIIFLTGVSAFLYFKNEKLEEENEKQEEIIRRYQCTYKINYKED